MAHSFDVLISRDALPVRAELQRTLARAKLPLVLPDDWTWPDAPGWSPMRWRDAESGCELEFGKASRKAVAAAKKAGQPGVDTAVTITTRGWESLQAGTALAAALVTNAGGCIDEGDGDIVAAGDALTWARRVVESAESHVQREREREAALAAATAAGGLDARFAQALATMAGAPVRQFVSLMDRLGFILEDGRRLSASAWRVQARDGRWFDQTRYARLRHRQVTLMVASPGAAQKKEIAAIEQQLDDAGAQDAQALADALAEIRAWPDRLAVASATWAPPATLTVRFDAGTAIEFVPTRMSAVEVPSPPLTFVLDGEGIDLR